MNQPTTQEILSLISIIHELRSKLVDTEKRADYFYQEWQALVQKAKDDSDAKD